MPDDSKAKPQIDDRPTFLIARTVCLLAGVITLLTCLSFYSPEADLFSLCHSLFAMFVLGSVFGGLVFGVSTGIAAHIWLPSSRTQRYSPKDSFEIKQNEEQPQQHPKRDWDNDYANVASPTHQIIENSLHHRD
jgi:hypothetical protein